MAFDVRQFLTNLSDPDLRNALDAQREREKERAKLRARNIGYLDAAGIMTKDAAADASGDDLERLVAADTFKRKVGTETIMNEYHQQQVDAMKRQAAQQAAAAAIFANPGNPVDPAMSPPVDLQGNAVPDIMAPQTRSSTAPSMEEQFMRGLPEHPDAANTEIGREIIRNQDPFKRERLTNEKTRLSNDKRRLDLEERRIDEGVKTVADEPSDEKKAELWDNGFYVVPNAKGGWDVKSRSDKENTAEVLGMLLKGSTPGETKEKNPYRTGAAGKSIPQKYIDYLKANPASRASFDKQFGTGAAAKILGD